MRIGLVRFEMVDHPDERSLISIMTERIDDAREQECELVVFPELINLCLVAGDDDAHVDVAELRPRMDERASRRSTERIVEALRQHADNDLAVFAGSYWCPAEPHATNLGYLIRPHADVAIIGKEHPTPAEDVIDVKSAAPENRVFEIGEVCVGFAICFDIEFPDVAVEMAASKPELIVCPSLTFDSYAAARVGICARARAIELQAYVAVVPAIGRLSVPHDGPLRGTGATQVVAPVDRVGRIADGVYHIDSGPADRVSVVDLDMDLLKRMRTHSEAPTLRHLTS